MRSIFFLQKMGGLIINWEGGHWGNCERNGMSKWNKAVEKTGYLDVHGT